MKTGDHPSFSIRVTPRKTDRNLVRWRWDVLVCRVELEHNRWIIKDTLFRKVQEALDETARMFDRT